MSVNRNERIRIPEHVRQRLRAERAQQEQRERNLRRAKKREHGHRYLIRTLIEVLEYDDSVAKLYAGVLLRHVLDLQPELRRQYQEWLSEVLDDDV
jgi:hypothetical protein